MAEIGRNDPCLCGSGKKYKKCCGAPEGEGAGAEAGAGAATEGNRLAPGAVPPAARAASSSYPEITRTDHPAYLRRPSTPGQNGERVVFINSIGGLGDSFLIPLVMELYKKFLPQDTTILYDSLFIHHYYEQPPYIDEIYRASEHIFANYAPQMILNMDETLPRDGGIPLRQTRFTRFASTHFVHGRKFNPEDAVIKMDWCTALSDSITHGFRQFDLRLKTPIMARVDEIMRLLRHDGRILVAIQNRGNNPYGTMQVDRDQYLREMTEIANAVCDRHGARVLICGDVKLESPVRYERGDWIALDEVVPNIYLKFEILKRCDYFLASPSGFSWIVNLMRAPEQSPAVLLYASKKMLFNEDLVEQYPGYVAKGGGTDNNLIAWTFRHRTLNDFLFDMPHTPEKALAFLDGLVHEYGPGGRIGL